MFRRFLCVTVCLLLCAAPALAASNVSNVPTRDVFSRGYERLEKAIARERPVAFSLAVTPTVLGGIGGSVLEKLGTLLGGVELSGTVQCFKEGGHFQLSVLSPDRREVLNIGQISQEEADRIGLNLTGEWLSISKDMEAETLSLLQLDEFGQALLRMDYDSIRDGGTPFVSALHEQGMTLWGLASPYSSDSDRLRVRSGATSHGVTYELDTAAVRDVLGQFAAQLTNEGFSIGLPGTELCFGLSDKAFDEFVQKITALSQTIELRDTLKFSTAFGEGDLLQSAKGEGQIVEDGKRTTVSYSYSCSPSDTRMTRKYNIDFQPRQGDTLSLSCTLLTSSNGSKSGAQEVGVSASGNYNGQPYKLRLKIEYVNKFSVDEGDVLHETIQGKATASLVYGGRTVADITVNRECLTASGTQLTGAVSIQDTYDTLVKNDEGTLFEGLITLSYGVEAGPPDTPGILEEATPLEKCDFMDLEVLRDEMSGVLDRAKSQLVQTVALSAMKDTLASH